MHEGACETGSQIPKVLITIITWHCQSLIVNFSNLHVNWRIFVDHIQMWATAVYNSTISNQMVTMPTILCPVTVENIARFPGLSEGDVENYLSVTRCHLKSLARCSWEVWSYLGAISASIEGEHIKRRPCPSLYNQPKFSSNVKDQDRADQIKSKGRDMSFRYYQGPDNDVAIGF